MCATLRVNVLRRHSIDALHAYTASSLKFGGCSVWEYLLILRYQSVPDRQNIRGRPRPLQTATRGAGPHTSFTLRVKTAPFRHAKWNGPLRQFNRTLRMPSLIAFWLFLFSVHSRALRRMETRCSELHARGGGAMLYYLLLDGAYVG